MWRELEPVLPLHYKELALNQDCIPLDINWERYHELEKAGVLHVFTARNDSELIGYIITLITPHLHYNSTIHGLEDIYYVKKEYRGNGIGYNFFQVYLEEMKRKRVKKLIVSTKGHQNHQKMFEALGFEVSDIVLVKVL